MQIACKCKAFIEDQGNAVVAVPRGVDDLSLQADSREEFSALAYPQEDTVIRCNRQIGIVFFSMKNSVMMFILFESKFESQRSKVA